MKLPFHEFSFVKATAPACWGSPKPQTYRLRVRSNTPFGVALRSLRSLAPAHPRRRGAAQNAPSGGFRDWQKILFL